MKVLRRPRAISWEVSVAVEIRDSRSFVSAESRPHAHELLRQSLENPVADLGEDFVAPDLPLADDRPRPLGIGALELARDAMAVEDGVGKVARRQAVARPDDHLDALVRPFARAARTSPS